jgi:hypothetical protein
MIMSTWYAIATCTLVLAVLIFGVRALVTYLRATGTRQQRLSLMWRDAETLLVAFVTAVFGAVGASVNFLAGMFNDPTIASAFNALLKAEYVPFYLAAIALITYLARIFRTQPDPVTGSIVAPPPAPKLG